MTEFLQEGIGEYNENCGNADNPGLTNLCEKDSMEETGCFKNFEKRGLPMKRITLEQLLSEKQTESYGQQYAYVMGLLESGRIRPLKASGKNGKKPALYREYWLSKTQKDEQELLEELRYGLVPSISIDYYLSHPESYREERQWVNRLSDYFRNEKEKLLREASVNERSFEIWNREKFLTKEQGKKILKHCGIEPEKLNMYRTAEPLAYYSHTRETPQKLLILENKDTFYSMRRHLLEGKDTILGVRIGTLIYGAGKGILRSFEDFDLCVEPYMKDEGNTVLYFGDLDYEGIGIYERLAGLCREQRKILPFTPAYTAMLRKAERVKELPDTKEQQNRNIQQEFFSCFRKEQRERMLEILKSGKYIPQEILNITDF